MRDQVSMSGTEAWQGAEAGALPEWLPETVQHYLAHTEGGEPIRALARRIGVHPSTVLRQVRRIECRRDDPLVDAGLQVLGTAQVTGQPAPGFPATHAALEQAAGRALRRLCESGAVLAVAEGMERAVVVRDGADPVSVRTAVVETPVARAMALMDWISCTAPGRVCRYRITAAGRMALGRILAEGENRAAAGHGFAEAQAAFAGDEGASRGARGPVESPLVLLSRRRDRNGRPFLEEGLVSAGERLREDFELARMGPRSAASWDRVLTGEGPATAGTEPATGGPGITMARARVERALADLGPGLGDVALRCCCFLEGLEVTEKKMGWSARSGKIVLRIALQRLRQHYDGLEERDQMIG